MKITRIETLRKRPESRIHQGAIVWTWVRIHTDEGLVGTGETYPFDAVESPAILQIFGPLLLGRDPRDIEAIWRDLLLTVQYAGWAGAEMRAISAIDIALWDLLGQSAGLPIYRLMGGACREHIRTYNTCYDNQYDFNVQADEMAKHLLGKNINAMKIWPFDEAARKNHGQFITRQQLRKHLVPFQKIRDAVGDDMEIMVEFHGFWNVPTAMELAAALEPYDVRWLEEILPQDNLDAYAMLRPKVRQPLAISERLFGKWQYRDLLQRGLADYVLLDLAWCGGLTEAKKIASMAEAAYLPIAPHNCGGPIFHAANIHLAANIPNLYALESVRRHYEEEYPAIVTEPYAPSKDGVFHLPEGPGLGTRLKDEFIASADCEFLE